MFHFKRYFFAGLLLWLPLVATFFIVRFLFESLNSTLSYLPHPVIFGYFVPGFNVIFTLGFVYLTGFFATFFVGRYFIRLGEAFLERIPLVRFIYKSLKQVLETLLKGGGESFRRVLLVQYPREGLWSLGFQTANAANLSSDLQDLDLIAVFIPTTPNPTSGFLIYVPKKDVIELNISIDEALKQILSMGVVSFSKS